MKAVWKFKIDSGPVQIPIGAKILTVKSQDQEIYLWALVDPSASEELRLFMTYGTGTKFDPPGPYIGTIFEANGKMVYHIFEKV